MQIHELNSATPAATDSIAMDNGTDTYKATPTTVVSNSAPTFTSGDASSPTAWESVSTISSGLGFGTLLNRITTMIKNVRYLYSRQGNTALTTTATTITGAINEHETDITATNTLMGDTSISDIGGGTVTGAISSLNSSLTDTFVTKNYTASANISDSKRYISASEFNVSVPSGYTPVAITAYSQDKNTLSVRALSAIASGGQGMMWFSNTTATAITVNASITILYVKTGLL